MISRRTPVPQLKAKDVKGEGMNPLLPLSKLSCQTRRHHNTYGDYSTTAIDRGKKAIDLLINLKKHITPLTQTSNLPQDQGGLTQSYTVDYQ